MHNSGGGVQTSSHQLSWLSFTKYSPCTYLWGNVSVADGCWDKPHIRISYNPPSKSNNTYIFLFFQIINPHHRKVSFLQVTQLARDRARLQIRCHSQAHTLSATACFPKVTERSELIDWQVHVNRYERNLGFLNTLSTTLGMCRYQCVSVSSSVNMVTMSMDVCDTPPSSSPYVFSPLFISTLGLSYQKEILKRFHNRKKTNKNLTLP